MEEHYNLTHEPDLCRDDSSRLVSILRLCHWSPTRLPFLSPGASSAYCTGIPQIGLLFKQAGSDMFSKLVSEFCLTDTESCFFCSERHPSLQGTILHQGQPATQWSWLKTTTTTTTTERCKETGTLCQQWAWIKPTQNPSIWPLNMTAYDPQISFFLGISVILLSVTIS